MTSRRSDRRRGPEAAPAPLALFDCGAAYGRIEVIHGIDVAVSAGGLTTLLGPNGAGKSTALSVMSGLMAPTRGCRHVHGQHRNGARAEQLARIGIRHIREGRSVYPNLNVLDNLKVAVSAGAGLRRVADVAFSLFPRLRDRRSQLAGALSVASVRCWPSPTASAPTRPSC